MEGSLNKFINKMFCLTPEPQNENLPLKNQYLVSKIADGKLLQDEMDVGGRGLQDIP